MIKNRIPKAPIINPIENINIPKARMSFEFFGGYLNNKNITKQKMEYSSENMQ